MRQAEGRAWSLPCPAGEVPSSWVIFQGLRHRVGAVRCTAEHPRWRRPNETPGWPVLIFPRQSVRIQPGQGDGGVVDPGRAIFIEGDAEYDRVCLDPIGDKSDWFGVSPQLISALLPGYDPADAGGSKMPRRFTLSARDYALQRRAFRHALVAPDPDELLIEEAICGMLESFRRTCERARPGRNGAIVDQLQELLAARFREPLGLTDLAGELGVSAPHLCRVFRQESGGTIHDHREKLRFAAALAAFERNGRDLTALALELGYSSHAHFTANFSRSIGQAPSQLRAAVRDGMLA